MGTSPTTKPVPVLVLGAGLTGLSAALELTRRGVPHRLIERLPVAGGHAVTTLDEGYRFDRTGHLLHLRDAALREEVLDWLEGDCREIARRSVIFSNGVYTRYPFQANTFGLPPAVASECLLGFVRAHFASEPGEPKNFEEFCLRHFGPGITRHFMVPYNARLWGVPATEITSAWCQRFVPLPKLEDVIAGAVGLNDRELGYNARFVYPRLGIGQLPRAMAGRLTTLELGRAPRRLELAGRIADFGDERVPFEALVSTLPLPALVALCDEVPGAVRAAAQRLRATHLYYLDVALERPPGKDFHWAYVPEAKYPFYRVGCYSHFSPELAPPGAGSLYVELAERRTPLLEDAVKAVVPGLVEMGVISGSEQIRFARLRRIDVAYVIFDHAY
ncbi:MAG TPA: FAD-dependent oxidoreductase, partial [Polyangiaceae bacterium]|nr:FAD-dependent oxidoreductase [Polyangiaceae bacterium]